MVVHVLLELPSQLLVDVLWVDEIAEAAPIASSIIILSAFSFAEVCDGRVFRRQLLIIIQLSMHGSDAFFGLLLGSVLEINVALHMVTHVVRDYHVEDLTVSSELFKDLLEKLLEVDGCFAQLLLRHRQALRERSGCGWILIKLEKEQRLAHEWFIVLSSARVAVPTCAYLVVKWTVDPRN